MALTHIKHISHTSHTPRASACPRSINPCGSVAPLGPRTILVYVECALMYIWLYLFRLVCRAALRIGDDLRARYVYGGLHRVFITAHQAIRFCRSCFALNRGVYRVYTRAHIMVIIAILNTFCLMTNLIFFCPIALL